LVRRRGDRRELNELKQTVLSKKKDGPENFGRAPGRGKLRFSSCARGGCMKGGGEGVQKRLHWKEGKSIVGTKKK